MTKFVISKSVIISKSVYYIRNKDLYNDDIEYIYFHLI